MSARDSRHGSASTEVGPVRPARSRIGVGPLIVGGFIGLLIAMFELPFLPALVGTAILFAWGAHRIHVEMSRHYQRELDFEGHLKIGDLDGARALIPVLELRGGLVFRSFERCFVSRGAQDLSLLSRVWYFLPSHESHQVVAKILEMNPGPEQRVRALLIRAMLHRQEDRPEEAWQTLNELEAFFKRNPAIDPWIAWESTLERANLKTVHGSFQESTAMLDQLTTDDPHRIPGHVQGMMVSYRFENAFWTGRFEDALLLCTRKRNPFLIEGLEKVDQRLESGQLAHQFLEELQDGVNEAFDHLSLLLATRVYSALDRHEESLELLEKVLLQDALHPVIRIEAIGQRAMALAEMGRFDELEGPLFDLQSWREKFEHNRAFLTGLELRLSIVERLRGNPAVAVELARSALARRREPLFVHIGQYHLGMALEAAGDSSGARECFERVLDPAVVTFLTPRVRDRSAPPSGN